MLNVESSTTERVEQVISDLEKLKSRVSGIETRYTILSQDYSQICEEALSLVSKLKSRAAQPGGNAAGTEAGKANHRSSRKSRHASRRYGSKAKQAGLHKKMSEDIHGKEPPGTTLSAYTIEQEENNVAATESEIAIARPEPSPNIEAQITSAMVNPEKADIPLSPLITAAGYEEINYNSPPLEDLLRFQRQQVKKARQKSRITAASCIDAIGRGIEVGLDKLGDGLIFPFVLVEKIVKSITRK